MKQSLNNELFPTNHSLPEILARQAQQPASRSEICPQAAPPQPGPTGLYSKTCSAAQTLPSHHPSCALPSPATPSVSIVTGTIHTSWKDMYRYSSHQPEHEETLGHPNPHKPQLRQPTLLYLKTWPISRTHGHSSQMTIKKTGHKGSNTS